LSRELRELLCVAQVPWERTIKYLLLAMCDRCTCRVNFSLTSVSMEFDSFVGMSSLVDVTPIIDSLQGL